MTTIPSEMIFKAKTSTLKSAVQALKKQKPVDLQEQDVSTTAFCSDSESSDTEDCLVEESISTKVSSLKLSSDDSDQIAADSVFASVFASVSASPPGKQKKRARFALGKTQIFYVATLAELSVSEQEDCWWGPKDYRAFRFAAKNSSYEARIEGSNNLVQCVDDGYPTATNLACTMQEHEMERAMAEYKIVKFTEGLKAWACKSSSCRGLEHWTSKKYFQARIEAMEESKDVVIQLAHFEESADEIAKHYQATSRPARILARLRGHADYEASVDIALVEEELAAAALLIAY
jgi:hypothetical protein